MRKRVVTLYSGKGENESGDEAPPTGPPPADSKEPEASGNTAQVIREIAEGMFVSMCEGLDEEVITEENMEDAVQNLADVSINPTYSLVQTQAYAFSSGAIKSSIRKLLQDAIKRSSSGEVTCELFCEAAICYAEGNICLFDMMDTNIAPKTADGANLETLLYNPGIVLPLMKRGVLKLVERRGSRWLWSFFSTKHFYWFLAVYFVPMMTIQVIVSSVSTALFNATMLFLLVVTVKTAINSEVVQSRIEYLSLFQYFNKVEGRIKMPVLSNVAHYITFVGGVVVGVVFLGFSYHSFVYYELLAFISMIVSSLVVLQFDLYESPLLWLGVLAKSPGWLVLGVEKVCSLFGYPVPQLLNSMREPIWRISLFDELYFDINAVTIFHVIFHLCVLLVLLVKWRSVFRSPGPHILFFGWFVLCRNFISNSNATHLVVVFTVVVLFPFYTLAFFLSPFYFLYYYTISPPLYYSLASIGIIAVIATLIALTFKYKRDWWLNLSIEYVLLLCLAACICLVMFLSGWYASVFAAEPLPPVSLEEYNKYCGPGNWMGGNMVQTQIDCMHLQGRVWSSRADVESVSISRVQNSMADSIAFLPYSLERALTCYLGKSDPMCGDRTGMSTCIYTGCHFQDSLTYTFKVELKIPLGHETIEATMLVSHRYKDFIAKLQSGASLHFDAVFMEGMGSRHLTLQAQCLSALGLDNTRNLDKEKEMEIKKSIVSVFLRSVKNSVMMIMEIFFGYAV